MEMVAQLRESQIVSENGQEKIVDLSKASREAASSTSTFSAVPSKFLLSTVSTPVSDAFKSQMELLQAGLSRTPTRHLLNGSLIDVEPPMKRRRGRRKNVEGLDLLFISGKQASLTAVRKYFHYIIFKKKNKYSIIMINIGPNLWTLCISLAVPRIFQNM